MSHSGHNMGMDMDMGGHDHGNMDMGSACKMNMVFTWDTTDMCVVFQWWHVQTGLGLLMTLLTIVGLGMGYEYIRSFCRKYDENYDLKSLAVEDTPLTNNWSNSASKNNKLLRSGLYAFQVFYSFMLMLIFMTYNGWAMVAVTVGAFLGHFFWGSEVSRGLACH